MWPLLSKAGHKLRMFDSRLLRRYQGLKGKVSYRKSVKGLHNL
jgi:hypothetical protein